MRRVVKRKGSACRSRCFCCPGEACVTYACNALLLLCLRIAGLYSPCNTRMFTSVYAVPLVRIYFWIWLPAWAWSTNCFICEYAETLNWMWSVLLEAEIHSWTSTDKRFNMFSRKRFHFQTYFLLSLVDMLMGNILDSRYSRTWGDFRSPTDNPPSWGEKNEPTWKMKMVGSDPTWFLVGVRNESSERMIHRALLDVHPRRQISQRERKVNY